jgi:hypothetical protein
MASAYTNSENALAACKIGFVPLIVYRQEFSRVSPGNDCDKSGREIICKISKK